MTDYEREAKDFLFGCKAKMIIKFQERQINPEWGDALPRNKYHFTITTPFGSMEGDFWDSLDNTQKGIKPTEYDSLACLEKYDVGTSDDFVSEFGYEVHSWSDVKQIENTYRAVKKEYQDLCRIFTPEQMERLRKIQWPKTKQNVSSKKNTTTETSVRQSAMTVLKCAVHGVTSLIISVVTEI